MFPRIFSLVILIALTTARAQEPRVNLGAGGDWNAAVLRMIDRMPEGGSYATNAEASRALAAAISVDATGISVDPLKARPSYCSGATYLVFVGVLRELARQGRLSLDEETLGALTVRGQRDGQGVWGRWNANGPGTARFFAELKLGRNFTDWKQARAGDFMKVWWNDEIGKLERGHSVIFLGAHRIDGVEHVNFWSSNQPGGYGHKLVPRSKIKWAVFSRLENPAGLAGVRALPESDAFLASLLSVRSSQAEVRAKCAVE